MDLFQKIVNRFYPLSIFAKRFHQRVLNASLRKYCKLWQVSYFENAERKCGIDYKYINVLKIPDSFNLFHQALVKRHLDIVLLLVYKSNREQVFYVIGLLINFVKTSSIKFLFLQTTTLVIKGLYHWCSPANLVIFSERSFYRALKNSCFCFFLNFE